MKINFCLRGLHEDCPYSVIFKYSYTYVCGDPAKKYDDKLLYTIAFTTVNRSTIEQLQLHVGGYWARYILKKL